MKNKLLFVSILLASAPFLIFAEGTFDQDLYFGVIDSPDVASLQAFLEDQGVYQGPVTGNFLILTREGVKKFQEREKITPTAGYFGPLTRARVNAILRGIAGGGGGGLTPTVVSTTSITSIISQIQILQEKIKELQLAKLAASSTLATSTTALLSPVVVAATSTAPVFTKRPVVTESGFVDNPPLGAQYPYRVVFDWEVDKRGYVEESVTCTPPLKIVKPAGILTAYYPTPHTTYTCVIVLKDQTGSKTSADLVFTSPVWIGIGGGGSLALPQTAQNPLKVGDFPIYNGATSSILFSQIVMDVSDELNSFLNRGRQVYFVLRKGTTTADEIISSTPFTFSSTVPQPSLPNTSQLGLSYPLLMLPGEEKVLGLWIDGLELVTSGTLKISLNKVLASTSISPLGKFSFTLTK